jgi:hypothetical protein
MNSQAADGDTTLNKAPADRETPSEEGPTELPLPSDPKSVFLGGLFILALLGAAYVARDIILPLIFACVLNLLLQPALRLLGPTARSPDGFGFVTDSCITCDDYWVGHCYFGAR